jgi:hypothetical protein
MQPIVASHTTSISSINTSLTDIQSSITALEDGSSSSGLQTQIDTLRTDTDANTTLTNNLLTSLQSFGTSLTAVEANVTALRTDTDANTLQGSQLLTAIQYHGTSIYAIDQAIQISNGKVAILETTQITQDNLIREFDQLFNEPANGVVDKLNNIISTYNTHISGVYLTLRQNVDGNNLILGTLSTQTTSLLTAMTQIYTRVQVLEDNAPPTSSNFDLFDEYPSTNYVSGGVIQTSSNITVEQALEIGLTITNLHAIVHNVGGTTYYCGSGGSLVSGQPVSRTVFVKK